MGSTGDQYGVAPPGYRLPSGSRPGRVRLQVGDLQRSLEYYVNLLGFTIRGSRFEGVGGGEGVALAAGAGGDPLVELHELRGAKPVPSAGRLGLYHLAILLPDRAALGSFARHLAESGERVGASDHLVSEAFYLTDPDGLGIEVYADRPRSTWRSRDRQLLMDTRPLDIADLVSSAGERRWSGLPGGARIGHVHLHVGDIAEARSFYHDSLGFDAVVWSYPGALFLAAGGYHHHLGVNTWATGATPCGPDDARLIDWEMLLPTQSDVDAAGTSVQAHGYTATFSAGHWWTVDPWGVGLRIRSEG